MLEQQVTIINRLGLHARAASKLVATASTFGCKVELDYNGKVVDGKSIMSVMMLAAGKGSQLMIRTDGEDEQEAMTSLCELIADYFGEGG